LPVLGPEGIRQGDLRRRLELLDAPCRTCGERRFELLERTGVRRYHPLVLAGPERAPSTIPCKAAFARSNSPSAPLPRPSSLAPPTTTRRPPDRSSCPRWSSKDRQSPSDRRAKASHPYFLLRSNPITFSALYHLGTPAVKPLLLPNTTSWDLQEASALGRYWSRCGVLLTTPSSSIRLGTWWIRPSSDLSVTEARPSSSTVPCTPFTEISSPARMPFPST
jgi:hypothetical protein